MPEITVRLWRLSHADVKTVVGMYILFHFMQSLSSLQRLLGPLAVTFHGVAACSPSPMGHNHSRKSHPDTQEREHWQTQVIAKLKHQAGHFETK